MFCTVRGILSASTQLQSNTCEFFQVLPPSAQAVKNSGAETLEQHLFSCLCIPYVKGLQYMVNLLQVLVILWVRHKS